VTVEDRLVVDLSDIRTVRIECTACGASINVNPEKWPDVPFNCPGCNLSWHIGTHTPDYRAVNSFRVAFMGLVALTKANQLPYRIRLETDTPKGSTR